ncbi:hypothetical protein NM208_g1285 [Fusarium decemcellulare]|uniref:Uncharacterized protein n=1 Tax=Fusarium decemcellulare TaxID=57161 RepID=A0ACC1SWE9_9HYPO|nr:hypothetical protein NM208_g1285 [Fusarium decemcellulare]
MEDINVELRAKLGDIIVPFLYLNNAGGGQDVFQGYGPANMARLRSIKEKYDESGMLTNQLLCLLCSWGSRRVWQPMHHKGATSYTAMMIGPRHYSNSKDFYETSYGPSNDPPIPMSHGIVPFDSHLLGPEHLRSPDLTRALSGTAGSYGALMTAPGMAVGDGKDTSANPSWRRATVLLNGFESNTTNVDGLRELAPGMGTYINEASINEPDWSKSFWGDNYPRLSALKAPD